MLGAATTHQERDLSPARDPAFRRRERWLRSPLGRMLASRLGWLTTIDLGPWIRPRGRGWTMFGASTLR